MAELRSNTEALVESVADNPAPAAVWDIAVHHTDVHEALGLPRIPERLWLPVADALAQRSPDLADQVPAYELFRAAFSRRSRGQMQGWGTGLAPEELDGVCIFGPREDDQPVPDRPERSVMATYTVNRASVRHARDLIAAKRWVLDSDWGDVQPDAAAENAFLEKHSWKEYAAWHLGLTEGANDETKARHAFVYGDLTRIHRSGLIACVYRAAEWRHKKVEVAAHRLLQELDKAAGIG